MRLSTEGVTCHQSRTNTSVTSSEKAQPTLGPWTGFEPVRLETPRTTKHAWFHCTTVANTLTFQLQILMWGLK
ncbi:hypothetical protein E2C01_025346 [Portunus trituberculatus]|uniref:Uncharacterized protein n=1 Tax=Portunus trituberculatus TaxID=210409 RepID=A0A5B7EG81_PORTR|nr:hypothetical protein [Portunus trituberculatus]